MSSSTAKTLFENLDTDSFENADLLVRYLEQIGVEYVFGVPGGAIEPIYNALARSERRGGIRPVAACHECGAAYMADGYARETGKLGVCIATSGPGATNLITGIACSFDNNIPVLAITGQPALPSFGRGALQESTCTGVNVLGMFRHCTRYNSLISHTNQFETKVVNAILTSQQGAKGPAHLSIPVDILRDSINNDSPRYNLADQLNKQNTLIDEHAIKDLEVIIASAKRIVFLIGHGSADAIDEIMELVHKTHALFVTTPDAKGLINPRHKAYRGVFGFGGHASAINTLESMPDVIVAIGTSFGEFASSGWSDGVLNDRLVHVDCSEENLLRSPMAKLHVRGNIKIIFNRINQNQYHSETQITQKSTNRILKSEINPFVEILDIDKYLSDAKPIKPQRLMKELSIRFPSDTRFIADAGNSMIWTPHYLQLFNRREYQDAEHPVEQDRRSHQSPWLRMTLDFAPMGWAIGASIGIARANANRPTVCVTGDGSYLMSGQEISIAIEERLPVIFIILNDGVYGMVMHGQRLAKAEPIGFELPKTNFKLMAKSMGIEGYIVESAADFDRIDIPTLCKKKGPTLIDVRIDKEEVPPMKMRLHTLGSIDNSCEIKND